MISKPIFRLCRVFGFEGLSHEKKTRTFEMQTIAHACIHADTCQDANALLVFNVEHALSTDDRRKFILTLAHRVNVDGEKAWRDFIGNGNDTGACSAALSGQAQAAYFCSQGIPVRGGCCRTIPFEASRAFQAEVDPMAKNLAYEA